MNGILTIRDLQQITGQPAHVINHAINRHGPTPADHVGIARVWRFDDLPRIQESLAKTAQRSASRKPREVATQ